MFAGMFVHWDFTLYLFFQFLSEYSYVYIFVTSDWKLVIYALHLQALESIEKAQELAEGLGNKVGPYSFSSLLSLVFCQAI